MELKISVDLANLFDSEWDESLLTMVKNEAEYAIKTEVRKIAKEWAKQQTSEIEKKVKSILNDKAKVSIK